MEQNCDCRNGSALGVLNLEGGPSVSHLALVVARCVDLEIVLLGTRWFFLTRGRSLSYRDEWTENRENETTFAKETQLQTTLMNNTVLQSQCVKESKRNTESFS